MDTYKITNDLKRRFAEPLPEFYRRRIIVWYDEDREFEQQLDDIKIDGVKVVALTGSNNFSVKKLISVDEPRTNILLYNPCSYEKPDENWLLDVELYSEEFRADIIAIWMDEMGIESTTSMRQLVKQYRKFFNAKPRRDKIAKLNNGSFNTASLNVAIMSVIAETKNVTPAGVIKNVLAKGLDNDSNCYYRDFVSYGITDAFWEMVYQGTGYTDEEKSLKKLMEHMMLSAVSCTYKQELPQKWERVSSDRARSYCYDLLIDWIHSEDAEIYRVFAEQVEDELGSMEFFAKRPVDDLLDINCFPRINQLILSKIMTNISNENIDVEKIRTVVDKRRVCAFYADYEHIYEGLRQLANMQDFYLKHASGFHLTSAKEIWKAYTEDYFRMDQYYRLLHLEYEHYLLKFNADLNDLYKTAVDKAENLYNNWYLENLSSNWSNISSDGLSSYGKIHEIPHQDYFYSNYVAKSDNRVFVIISDAMRYEVASELNEKLALKQQSKVNLTSQQAVIPTITKCGMAALLPHRNLEMTEVNGEIKVLVDDMSSDASNRENVLKTANRDSCVLKYNDIIAMKSSERSELVKGMKVVYIYHDMIDEVSHKSDTEVFDACNKTVEQLSNLVDIMVKDFKALNIFITADHGFLYTYSPLEESAKLEKSDLKGYIIEIGRRYAFMKKNANPDYLLKVKTIDNNDSFDLYTPKTNVRIKSGGGMKFVHGGTSLQEMVVPIIEYHYVNAGTKEYQKNKDAYDSKPVSLSLLSSNSIISNRNFPLDFYQNEPVSSTRSVASYQIYLVDDMGTAVSDVQRIIADKTFANGKERVYTVRFSLKSIEFSRSKSYYLVIADEDGMEVSRKEFEIAVASEFGSSESERGSVDYFL